MASVDRNANRNPEGFALTTWRSYLAEVPAWLIVFGALAVSFWTQVFAVGRHDLAYWEALIWGASTDAGTIAFLFLAREGIHRNTPTWGAWVGSSACAFMSVQWNVIPAWERGDFLGVEAHLWMPALALGTWYWLLHGRKRKWDWRRKQAETLTLPDPEPEPPSPLPPHHRDELPQEPSVETEPETATQPETNGRQRVTLAQARTAYRKLAAKGPVSGAALGRALGVSEVSGRNWKRKVEGAEAKARPFRVMSGPEAA